MLLLGPDMQNESSEPANSFSDSPIIHVSQHPSVSDAFAWAERLWGDESPAARGLFAFDEADRQGTMLVTRGRRPGNIRIDAQFSDKDDTYTELSAEVREGWMRDAAAGESGYGASYNALLDLLLEIALLPNQRTVRVGRLRRSA